MKGTTIRGRRVVVGGVTTTLSLPLKFEGSCAGASLWRLSARSDPGCGGLKEGLIKIRKINVSDVSDFTGLTCVRGDVETLWWLFTGL